ncbi:hypothetical protein ACFFX1_30570 [Dactylosporangium sucinum]|uniref:Uncharacterized protein n=1 Tax=Dactylosporangium sucinum TaxID=1424081 RepID=A0A917U7J8_9ACTN|nr:hypothetical protein [Dactylosporangium sucinum]GGM63889.1 hypothetical protein GCM10007977_076800 [Dactylosporangium sucinum]
MADETLLDRVRRLREQGGSPKQIAKQLGIRPADATALVRRLATQQTSDDPADRALLGCWINQSWSVGLGMDQAPVTWAALDPLGKDASSSSGFANILLVRQDRASRVAACGYLVDVYCLGIKNSVGPVGMSLGKVDDFVRDYYSAYDEPPVSIPIEVAQALVHGGAAYAKELGFEPHADFAAAAPYLGVPDEPSPIRFGRDGKPFYISGPYDNPRDVIATLEANVGTGNYNIMTHV